MSTRVDAPIYVLDNGSLNKGLITQESPDVIGNALQSCQNVVITRKGFGPRKGYRLVGANDNTGTAGQGVRSLFSYKQSGTATITDSTKYENEILIRGHATFLEWWNERGGTAGEWHTLVSGLTADELHGSLASFNTTTLSTATNRCFMGNGVENLREFNGAHTDLTLAALAGATTITVRSTTSFPASGDLLVNGTAVTYTGPTATTFTGVGDMPAASVGDGVVQATTTSGGAAQRFNFLLTAFTRLFGFGGRETTVMGNRLSYSQAGTSTAAPDPTNFTTGTALVDPGLRDFPDGGSRITAIAHINDRVLVFKEHGVYTYTFDFTQATTKFDIVGTIIEGPDVGCGAVGAVTEAINQIFFVSKRGGLKTLTTRDGVNLYRPFQITERILPTLEDFDFSNAKIHYHEKDHAIMVSCASAKEIELDTIIYYDLRRDALTLFKNVAAESFATYKGDTYFGAPTTARVYRLFDGLTDNGANINASATTQRYVFGDAASPKALDAFYIEGFIKSGKTLNVRFDFDDRTQSYKQIALTGDSAKDYIYEIAPNTFGEFEFGAYPFGGDPDDFSDLYVFRVYLKIENTLAYNTDVTFWSSGPGESWFVKNYGWAPTFPQKELPKNILYL